MSISLSSLDSSCFQGVLPAILSTCSKDGEPNVTYLSQVHYVDERHVALTRQFFNKTTRNVEENPYASVELCHPVSFEAYRIDLRFERTETKGPLFDTLAMRIDAIASLIGMAGVFKLIGADVYEVLDVEVVKDLLRPAPHRAPRNLPPVNYRSELRALQVVSDRLNRADNLEDLFASLLAAMRDELGFEHAMILLPDESGEKLFTVASIGYGESGVGAEVTIGQGIVGTVAQQRKILRMSAVDEALRYGRAIRTEAHTHGTSSATPEIALPGLPDVESHLALPLVLRDKLVAVLAVESKNPLQFADWHEAFLNIIANQTAVAIERMLEDEDEDEQDCTPSQAAVQQRMGSAPPKARSFKFYRGDDSIFVDGEYLIRNVPGRILWRLLKSYVDEKRAEFTNRELRLDPFLGLPAIKDNLESRLILLRKRLEQKCPEIRIPSCGRGHFRLELDCPIELIEKTSP